MAANNQADNRYIKILKLITPILIGIAVFMVSIALVRGPINWSAKPFNIFPSALASGGFATVVSFIYMLYSHQVAKERTEAIFRTNLKRDIRDQHLEIASLKENFRTDLEDLRREFREVTNYQGMALTALLELLPKEDMKDLIAEKLKESNPKYLQGYILLKSTLQKIAEGEECGSTLTEALAKFLGKGQWKK
jgi:hypothetical protein